MMVTMGLQFFSAPCECGLSLNWNDATHTWHPCKCGYKSERLLFREKVEGQIELVGNNLFVGDRQIAAVHEYQRRNETPCWRVSLYLPGKEGEVGTISKPHKTRGDAITDGVKRVVEWFDGTLFGAL